MFVFILGQPVYQWCENWIFGECFGFSNCLNQSIFWLCANFCPTGERSNIAPGAPLNILRFFPFFQTQPRCNRSKISAVHTRGRVEDASPSGRCAIIDQPLDALWTREKIWRLGVLKNIIGPLWMSIWKCPERIRHLLGGGSGGDLSATCLVDNKSKPTPKKYCVQVFDWTNSWLPGSWGFALTFRYFCTFANKQIAFTL